METKYNIIENENASNHWEFLDIENQVVLDLGCGRWYITDEKEYTPFYFNNRNAKKIIGVDGDSYQTDYFIEQTKGLDQYTFINKMIRTTNDLIDLINEYSITVIKCDIEGHETILYDLTEDDVKNVIEIAIEFHSESIKNELIKYLEKIGFYLKVFGVFSGTNEMGVLFFRKNNNN